MADEKLIVEEPEVGSGDGTEKIRQRAYELYELRGREEGHELDDWLTAELETTADLVK